MPKSTEPLTPAQVYRFAVAFCQPRLAFRSVGKVTSEVLVTVLFAAAARISSISETCRRLRDAPCEETYANALYANLFCLEELKRKVNAAFVDHLPRPLHRPRKRPLRLGVDLTLLPYYGQHSLESREIYRSQAKRGTNSFFAYATAYLVLQGQRFTLAVTPVMRSECLKEVLQELLLLVSKAGLKPGLLLLDRGFYSVAVIRYLQRARRPFLMPVVCHGRKADHPKGPSGSNVFKQEKKSGWFRHTLKDGKKDKATVWICVKRARWVDRHGRRKSDTWVYAYWGITPRRVDWVKETYRKRFGIETSYRQMNQCRIRTTTKKFNVRFLYVAIGLLLRNLWVWLHHFVLSSPRRGGRRYNWDLLRGTDAALAGACGRNDVWTGRHNSNGKRYARISSVLTHRTCSFGKY